MRKKKLWAKLMAAALSAAMVVGMMPVSSALAVTGDQVAADGTYSATAHVTRNEEEDVDDEWEEYDVTVTLTVEDGVFTAIEAEPGSTYDDENSSYFNKAVEKSKGIQTLLVGEAATEDTINSWDTVSGATRTSTAVKEAALAAISQAEEASADEPVQSVDTTALETAVASAKALNEEDYTEESWSALQAALTDAEAVLAEPESQDAVDAAATALESAMAALEEAETDAGNTDDNTDDTGNADDTEYVYVTMNVPYMDFFEAYNLTDEAVWEVEEGLDAVSTATTSKFTGTTGLANGTYNDGTYILGVTLPVAVSAEDFAELDADLTENNDYYYVVLDEEPAAYSTLTIDETGDYSFTVLQDSTVNTSYLSVDDLDITGSYGDYQVSLIGVGTDKTIQVGESETVDYGAIYGAILETADGGSYGMTALENLWFGTKVEDVEIAWSIVEGQQMQRAHGSGGLFYQFEGMNGATLTGVTLMTDLGIIEIDCNIELPEYYDGDLTQLAGNISNDSAVLEISGIPAELGTVTITVSGSLASGAAVENIVYDEDGAFFGGTVQLSGYPEDGVSYTVTISSESYPDISFTVSTLITDEQKEELQYWIDAAKALDAYEESTDLQEHAAEAEEMIANEEATSVEAAELIEELMGKVKAYYQQPTAEATLYDSVLTVTSLKVDDEDIELSDLADPTYTLTYTSGRNTATLASGELDSLEVTLSEAATAGTTYTLTIVSDNYQDIVVSVEAVDTIYILMNIPYAEFYMADLNNDVSVDTFTSATLNKTRTGTLAGGSYHVNSDGSDITGITFPVKVNAADVEAYAAVVESLGGAVVTDDSSVTISVTNRGTASETTYEGSDALFESASYSYYVLTETPSYYKELTIESDGSLSFGATVGETTTITGVDAELSTDTSYGDYELDLTTDEGTVADAMGITTSSPIYGVIINTVDGDGTEYNYGLRHIENIWRVYELAWCTGFTTSVHNCPTSSEHYVAMMGQTITSVTYYTENGIYVIDIDDTYVPVTLDVDVEVEDALVTDGTTNVTVTGLPEDFDAVYSVSGLEASYADGILSWTDAQPGSYTLTITDASGKYVAVTAEFTLSTTEIPVMYNEDSNSPALVKTEDAAESDFENYIANITTVNVNGTEYAATGHSATTIINEDGTLATDAFVTEDSSSYVLTVTSTGYPDYTFTYAVPVDASALEAAIANAETLTESDYTADSWAVLQTALSAAKEALASAESQEAVDAATLALNAAMESLVVVSTSTDDTDSGDDDSSDTASDDSSSSGSSSASGTSSNSSTGSSSATGSSSSSTSSSSTATGDSANLWIWVMLVLVAAAAGGVVVKRRKNF